MRRTLVLLLVFLVVVLTCPYSGQAETDKGPAFAMELIPPANQIGYEGYHVIGRSGAIISLKARLTNLTNGLLDIYIVPLNAYSGPEGIFYQSPGEVDSQTYALADEKYGLAQCIDVADKITLMPKQTTAANIYVRIPLMKAGTLLGSIRFIAYKDGQQPDNEMSGGYQKADAVIQIDLPVEAQSSVVVGVPETDGQMISIPVTNESAAITKNVSGAVEIRNEAGSVVLKGEVTLPEMAPMTEYHILQRIENQMWKDGPYTLNVQIDTDGQKSVFIQTFSAGEENQLQFGVMQEIKPAETVAGQQKEESGVAANPQGTGLVVAVANQQTQEEQFAESHDALYHTVVSCVVFGIPAVFVCMIVWMYAKNRKRGKHERPGRWVINSNPAAGCN